MSFLHSGLFASLLSSAVPAAPTLVLPEPCCVRDTDEHDLSRLAARTRQLLEEHGLEALVTARVKSPRSVQQKMRRKQVGPEEILDRLGLRIQVATEAECYAVLELLHTTHREVPGSFDDYIRHPKDNGYQSLHTAVITNRPLRIAEFQVRTFEMHEVAEHGTAAHRIYKAQAA